MSAIPQYAGTSAGKRRAILHVGLHKTGTTFLQHTAREWLAVDSPARRDVFYSSQHAKESGWLELRTKSFLYLRDRIAFRANGLDPIDEVSIRRLIEELSLSDHFRQLCEHFDRREETFLHSDENTLGATFGHYFPRKARRWPFYPNGDWIAAIVALAAATHYSSVELVVTIRRFDEMILSSLKDAVFYDTRAGNLADFRKSLTTMAARFESVITRLVKYGGIGRIHIIDFDILRRSQERYFSTLLSIVGDYSFAAVSDRKLNASRDARAVVEDLVRKNLVKPDFSTASLEHIVGQEFLDGARSGYDRAIQAIKTLPSRVSYYD